MPLRLAGLAPHSVYQCASVRSDSFLPQLTLDACQQVNMPGWGALPRGIIGAEEVFDPTTSNCVGSDSAVGVDKLSMHSPPAATSLKEMIPSGIFSKAGQSQSASIERCYRGELSALMIDLLLGPMLASLGMFGSRFLRGKRKPKLSVR